jgi:hypothetical protein
MDDAGIIELVGAVNKTMSHYGWRAAYVEGAQTIVAVQRRRDGSRVRVTVDAGIAALAHDPLGYVLAGLKAAGWRDGRA